MDFAVSVESKFAVSLLRRFNTWYSVADGNWSNPNTWMSNALDKRNFTYPQPGDDVYINHTVTCDLSATVGNLRVSGVLNFTAGTQILTVNGDLQATGSVDQSAGANTILLNGVNNSIVSFTAGASSTVQYQATPTVAVFSNISPTQSILPLAYCNLNLQGGFKSTKLLSANLSVSNNLTLTAIINTNGFDVSVGGQTIGTNTTGTINSTTNILFIGLVNFNNGSALVINGAASIECRNGVLGPVSCTSANVNFTTNNQTITAAGGTLQANNITVTGAITVNTAAANVQAVSVQGTLNGTVSGSTFNNDGKLQVSSTATQMATGVFNYMHTAGSTLVYNIATGSVILPFSTYETLQLLGTGTVTAGSNLTLNKNLLVQGGIFDLSTFNLTVSGTTMVQSTLKKTGSGSVLFVGAVSFLQILAGTIDFSGGNPTVEFRGGIVDSTNNGTYITGTGAISFTTNNQTINITHIPQTWNAPITIAAGITVTDVSTAITYAGVINGASSTAIYDCRGTVNYTNATAPMVTGKFYGNQAANTFLYSAAGGQDIIPPSDPSTPGYKNLTLTGSGAKKLLGNVSVKGTYTLSGTATLNSNGFALTNP